MPETGKDVEKTKKALEANFDLLLQELRDEAAKNGLTEEILEALLNDEKNNLLTIINYPYRVTFQK